MNDSIESINWMRRIVETYSACQWYAAFELTILSIIIIIIIQLLYCFHCSKRSLLLNVIIANQFCSSTLKKSYTFQTNNDACTMRIVINIRSLCHTSCVWSVYTLIHNCSNQCYFDSLCHILRLWTDREM